MVLKQTVNNERLGNQFYETEQVLLSLVDNKPINYLQLEGTACISDNGRAVLFEPIDEQSHWHRRKSAAVTTIARQLTHIGTIGGAVPQLTIQRTRYSDSVSNQVSLSNQPIIQYDINFVKGVSAGYNPLERLDGYSFTAIGQARIGQFVTVDYLDSLPINPEEDQFLIDNGFDSLRSSDTDRHCLELLQFCLGNVAQLTANITVPYAA
jgi:hypothetical protein